MIQKDCTTFTVHRMDGHRKKHLIARTTLLAAAGGGGDQLQQPPACEEEPSLPPDGPGIPPYPTLIPLDYKKQKQKIMIR